MDEVKAGKPKVSRRITRSTLNIIRADYRTHTAITVAEAADYAGVSPYTVRDWLNDKKFPCANRVGPYRVPFDKFQKYLRTGLVVD